MKRIIQILKDSRKVYQGFKILKQSKKTPDFAYTAMKKLFVQTNGRSNNVISSFIRESGYTDIDRDGVLGLRSEEHLKSIVNEINRNGYHVFESRLPLETVNSIVAYAKKAPCRYRKIYEKESKNLTIEFSEEILFDETSPVSPVYQFAQKDIVASPDLQKLIFDQSLLLVAQEYLNTKPLMDLIAMWWSAPFGGKGKSESAQMYHFDLDRIKFIKFFFYLTDVDGETGPHCYVKGSHKKLPAALNKQGRMTDEEVEAAFGKQNLLELCGEKGTIMVVDTRGLHKGKDLTKGKRLIFQIEFANSMFGQYYPPFNKPTLPPPLEKVFDKYNYTYSQIMN